MKTAHNATKGGTQALQGRVWPDAEQESFQQRLGRVESICFQTIDLRSLRL